MHRIARLGYPLHPVGAPLTRWVNHVGGEHGPENDAVATDVSVDAMVAVVSRALVAWYGTYVVSLLALVVLAAHLY